MKIISKYKDYYDHLVGIYGEDPLIVYVRNGDYLTNNTTFFKAYLNPYKYPESVTNKIGYYRDINGKFETDIPVGCFGDEKEYRRKYKYRRVYYSSNDMLHTEIHGALRTFSLIVGFTKYRFELDRYKNEDGTIIDDILFDKKRVNIQDRLSDAPIYIVLGRTSGTYYTIIKKKDIINNPILKDTFIPTYIDPESIWNDVCEYIGLSKEVEPKPLTDKQKVVQHGFDTVTSFRNM